MNEGLARFNSGGSHWRRYSHCLAIRCYRLAYLQSRKYQDLA
jgi:hypothetical protein